ncbi:hypothetical protein [Streptomyces sp. NPDC001089]
MTSVQMNTEASWRLRSSVRVRVWVRTDGSSLTSAFQESMLSTH